MPTDPTSVSLFLKGREVRFQLLSYDEPEEALMDMMEKLRVITSLSPTMIEPILAKEIAEYVTEVGTGYNIIDLVGAINLLYSSFGALKQVDEMAEEDKKSETQLANEGIGLLIENIFALQTLGCLPPAENKHEAKARISKQREYLEKAKERHAARGFNL